MKKVLLSAFLCTSFCLYSQTGTLSGNINDNSKIALPGAKLVLIPGDHYTTSDENGNFVFLNIPTGHYELHADYLGYGKKVFQVDISENRDTHQNIVYTMEKAKNEGRVKTISEVLIVGISRQNQARALSKQKSNSNITNIVSSDQVGKFPDSNIGDALKRVSGITMQNDQGEARNIIIRGLAPELNSVTLNGSRIPSAEGDNRNVQMDLIPSDMIQMIEVNKTLTSDQDADAIGGSVNLITKTAANKERISLSLASGYNPIRNKALFTNSFLYSNRFLGKKLGWVINTSYNNNDYGSNNAEAIWSQDKNGKVYVSQLDIRKYDVRRERKSIGTDFDFKINTRNNVRFSAMYNWRDDWENRYRMRIKKIKPLANDAGYEGRIERQTKAGILNHKNKGARLERQIMQNYSLRGEHILGSKMELNWTAAYSKAEEQRPNERYMSFSTDKKKLVRFDEDFGTEMQPLYTPVTEPALEQYKWDKLTEQNAITYEEEITGKVNMRIPLSVIDGQKGRLRFGAKTRLKLKKRDKDFFNYQPKSPNSIGTLAEISPAFCGNEGWNPISKYVPGYFPSRTYIGGLDLNNSELFTKEDQPAEYLSANYSAKENIYAGYLRWDQNITRNFSFITGLRVENTQTDYAGNIIQSEDKLKGSREVKNSYTNYLPNISFKYTPKENLVLRMAYTTAIARPNYYRLSPFVNVIPTDKEVVAGNPNLKSSYSHNYDFMAEYYFKSVGIISLGGFYKKINNFIYDYRDSQYNYDKFAKDFSDIENQLDPGEVYSYSQSRNGQSVSVYGFEASLQRQLDFLPGLLSHLGVYLNYTYTKSVAKGIYSSGGVLREGLMLPGTAPNIFNASLSWENKRFLARVSLNHTSAYLDELGDSSFYDRYYDKQTFLDANASFAITRRMRVFVEANNLTNQPLRYYQGQYARTMQMEYYKPRYTMGLKFDF
ncbi:TonB-dependent receptor [Riemerella columbipharyngis]|uniref:TonB-dependent receptor n=1 Tax=Riemerella columbipharyngis TaxID=1071918 RepID=A0A1G6YLB7_9FLAO|nr:TonB-dependent receptor [Riemerella columbipharyngis]SDD90477.1 TonB-dependent receptor [Riemerella columbipharyngis]